MVDKENTMDLLDMIESRIVNELTRLRKIGAVPIRTTPRWVRLKLLADIKVEFRGQRDVEVDEAYSKYKATLPKDGIVYTSVGGEDAFESGGV